MAQVIKFIFLVGMFFAFNVYGEEVAINEIDNIIESLQEKSNTELETPKTITNSDNKDLHYKDTAKLIVLNKITAKSRELELKLGEVKFFGNLSIEVHKCIKNASPYDDYSLILITVFDNKLDDDKLLVFHGWIVSKYPSLSTLEHPVYEVIPIDCL